MGVGVYSLLLLLPLQQNKGTRYLFRGSACYDRRGAQNRPHRLPGLPPVPAAVLALHILVEHWVRSALPALLDSLASSSSGSQKQNKTQTYTSTNTQNTKTYTLVHHVGTWYKINTMHEYNIPLCHETKGQFCVLLNNRIS